MKKNRRWTGWSSQSSHLVIVIKSIVFIVLILINMEIVHIRNRDSSCSWSCLYLAVLVIIEALCRKFIPIKGPSLNRTSCSKSSAKSATWVVSNHYWFPAYIFFLSLNLTWCVKVKYTGFKDKGHEERKQKFLQDITEGHTVMVSSYLNPHNTDLHVPPKYTSLDFCFNWYKSNTGILPACTVWWSTGWFETN